MNKYFIVLFLWGESFETYEKAGKYDIRWKYCGKDKRISRRKSAFFFAVCKFGTDGTFKAAGTGRKLKKSFVF